MSDIDAIFDEMLEDDDESDEPIQAPKAKAAKKKKTADAKAGGMAEFMKLYGAVITTEPVSYKQVIQTGLMPLDVGLGVGGIPLGSIWTLFGDESTGKTTLCQQIIGAAQEQFPDKSVLYIDAENKFNPDLARKNGMKITPALIQAGKVIIINPTVADGYSWETMIESMEKLMEISPSGVIVVCDSMDAMSTMSELAQTASDGGAQYGGMAKSNSITLKRICGLLKKTNSLFLVIQQTRDKISTGPVYGPPPAWTSGGRAIKFYSAGRIHLSTSSSIKREDEIIGYETTFKIKKNIYHRPHVVFKMELRYESDSEGFDKAAGLLDVGIKLGLIEKAASGAMHTFLGFEKPNGDVAAYNGRERARRFLMLNPPIAQELERRIRARQWGNGSDAEAQE